MSFCVHFIEHLMGVFDCHMLVFLFVNTLFIEHVVGRHSSSMWWVHVGWEVWAGFKPRRLWFVEHSRIGRGFFFACMVVLLCVLLLLGVCLSCSFP